MNRQRYQNDQSYRDGYDEGVVDGKRQLVMLVKNMVDEIQRTYTKMVDDVYGEEE